MFEVACTGKHHGDSILIRHVNGILIPNGPSWLNDSCYPCLGSQFNGIRHGEECIGGHYCALGVAFCLAQSDFSSANSAHLTSPNAKCHFTSIYYDRVGLDMPADFPAKLQCLQFLCGWLPLGDHLKGCRIELAVICGLHQHS